MHSTRIAGIMLAIAVAGSYPTLAAAPPIITFVTGSELGSQPAINDWEEIIWVKDGQIMSNQRGVLVSGVDASNIGISGLFANQPVLNTMYEFRDGSWRLRFYGGGRVDASEWLLHHGAYGSVTAYQLRGGVAFGLTQKLFGKLEYRWTDGSKPYLSLAGVPAKLEVNRRGFLVGVNHHF